MQRQQGGAGTPSGAQGALAALQLLASRLDITQANKGALDDCIVALKEIKERTSETSHTSLYPHFLKLFLPRIDRLLQQIPPEFTNGPKQEIRNLSLQILHRLPQNETLRSVVPRILSALVNVLGQDNEENALTCLSIISDLLKTFLLASDEATLQTLYNFVGRLFSHMERTIAKYLQPQLGGKCLQIQSVQRPAWESFKVMGEVPMNLIYFIRLHSREFEAIMAKLLPPMVRSISFRPQPPHVSDTNGCDAYRQLVQGQVKTLTFLTFLIRSPPYQERLRDMQADISKSVVGLLKACPPHAISTRKELLVATRHILATPFRNGFFNLVDQFLDESVLLGGNYWIPPNSINITQTPLGAHPLVTAREQPLMPLAYSTLADLIHHVRTRLTMRQLAKVIYIFSRNIHDASLPLSIQSTSVRLLLNLVDSIFHNREPERNESRPLLVHILHTIVQKFGSLRYYIPEVVQEETRRQEERRRSAENAKETEPMDSYYYYEASRPSPATSAASGSAENSTDAAVTDGDIEIILVSQQDVKRSTNSENELSVGASGPANASISSQDPSDVNVVAGTNGGTKNLNNTDIDGAASGAGNSSTSSKSSENNKEKKTSTLFDLEEEQPRVLETDCIKDVKTLINTMMLGLKTVLWCVCNYGPKKLERDLKSGGQVNASGSQPSYLSGLLDSAEMEMVANLLQWGFQCLPVYRHGLLEEESYDETPPREPISKAEELKQVSSATAGELDIINQFAEVFTVLDSHDFADLFRARLPLLVANLVRHPTLIAFPKRLLRKNSISHSFMWLLLEFVIDHFTLMSGGVLPTKKQLICGPDLSNIATSTANPLVFKGVPKGGCKAAATRSGLGLPSAAFATTASPMNVTRKQTESNNSVSASSSAAASPSLSGTASPTAAGGDSSNSPISSPAAPGASSNLPGSHKRKAGTSTGSTTDETALGDDDVASTQNLRSPSAKSSKASGRRPYSSDVLEEGVQQEANFPSILAQLVEILFTCVENYTEDSVAGPAPPSLGLNAGRQGDNPNTPSRIGGLTPGWIIAGNLQSRIEKLITLCFVLAPHMTSSAMATVRQDVQTPFIPQYLQQSEGDKSAANLVNQPLHGQRYMICASSQGRDCYLMTLRSLMRVIARRTVLQELVKGKIQNLLVPSLRALSQLLLHAKAESKSSRSARADLVAEVVLLFAVRVPRPDLATYTPILQNAFETALSANEHRNTELVRLALRILESWVDNLGSTEFESLFLHNSESANQGSPTFAHAIAKLLQPSPQPCGTGALRVLGKMGQRARLALVDVHPKLPLRPRTATERALVVEMHWAMVQQGQKRGGSDGAKLRFCLDQVAQSACSFLHETHQPEIGVNWLTALESMNTTGISPSPKRYRSSLKGPVSSAMAALAAGNVRSPAHPTYVSSSNLQDVITSVGSATHTPMQRALYTPVSSLVTKQHTPSDNVLGDLEDAEYYKQKSVQLLFACVAHMLDTSDLSELPVFQTPPSGQKTMRAFIEQKTDKVPFYQTPPLAASEGTFGLKKAQRVLLVDALFGLAEASCDHQVSSSTWPLLQGVLEFIVVAGMASSVKTPTGEVIINTGANVTGVATPAHAGRQRSSSKTSEDIDAEASERTDAPAVLGGGVDATVVNELVVRLLSTASPAHSRLAMLMMTRMAVTMAQALNRNSLDMDEGPIGTSAEPLLRDLVLRLGEAASEHRWEARLGGCIGLRHLLSLTGARWIQVMQRPILNILILLLETHQEAYGIDVYFHALTGLQEVIIANHAPVKIAPQHSQTSAAVSQTPSRSSNTVSSAFSNDKEKQTSTDATPTNIKNATDGKAEPMEVENPSGAVAESSNSSDAEATAPPAPVPEGGLESATEASSSDSTSAKKTPSQNTDTANEKSEQTAQEEKIKAEALAAKERTKCSVKALLRLLQSQYQPSRQACKRAFALLSKCCNVPIGNLLALLPRELAVLRQLFLSRTVRKRASGMQVVILDALAFLLDQDPCPIDLRNEDMRKRIVQTMADAIVLVEMSARPSSERSYVVCLEYNSHPYALKAGLTSFASSDHTPGCLHAGPYAFPDVPRSVALRVVAVELMRACLTRGGVNLVREMDGTDQFRKVRDRAVKLVITSALSSWPSVSRAAQNGLQIIERLSREKLNNDPQDPAKAVPTQVVGELLKFVTRSLRTSEAEFGQQNAGDSEFSPPMLQGTLAIVETFKSQQVIAAVATSLIGQLRSILSQIPTDEALSVDGELRTDRKLVGLDLASEILRVLSHFPEKNIMDNLKMVITHVLRLEAAAQRLTVEQMFSTNPATPPNTSAFFRIPGHLSSPMKEPLQLICFRFPARVITYLLTEMVRNKDLVRLCKQLLGMPQAGRLRAELIKPEHTSRLISTMLSLGSNSSGDRTAGRQEHIVLAFYAIDIIHTVIRYCPHWLSVRPNLLENLLSVWRDRRLIGYLRQEEILSWRQREFYTNMCNIFMSHFRHATKALNRDMQRRDTRSSNGASAQTTSQIEQLLLTAAAIPYELLTVASVRTTMDSATWMRFYRDEVAQNPVMDLRLAIVKQYITLIHEDQPMSPHIKEAALRLIVIPILVQSRTSRPFHTSRINVGGGRLLGEELVREIIASVPSGASAPGSVRSSSSGTPASSSGSGVNNSSGTSAGVSQNTDQGQQASVDQVGSKSSSLSEAQPNRATGHGESSPASSASNSNLAGSPPPAGPSVEGGESKASPPRTQVGERATADNSVSPPNRSTPMLSSQLVQKLRTPPFCLFDITPSSREALQVQLLKLATLLIANYGEELDALRKELIKFAWNHLKHDDSSSKQWAYVNICTFINVYRTPPDIILQVFVALLREHSSESRHLVRKSLDLLVPALAKRLKVQKYTRAIRWTKKLATDESQKLAQLTHIWQLVASHPELFYQNRQHFLPQIVSSLAKLLVPQTMATRVLAVDLAELFLRWELTRSAEEVVWENAASEEASSSDLPLRLTAAKESARGFRSNAPMVTAVLNFLIRASMVLAESKEPESSSLQRRCMYLFQQLLDFASRMHPAVPPTATKAGAKEGLGTSASTIDASKATPLSPLATPSASSTAGRRQWIRCALIVKQIELVVKKQKERTEQGGDAAAKSAAGKTNTTASESQKEAVLNEESPGVLYCILEILTMIVRSDKESIAEPFYRENARYLRGIIPAVFGCAERGIREIFLVWISHLTQIMPIPLANSSGIDLVASTKATTVSLSPASTDPASPTRGPQATTPSGKTTMDNGFYSSLFQAIEQRLFLAADDGKKAMQDALQSHQQAVLQQQQQQQSHSSSAHSSDVSAAGSDPAKVASMKAMLNKGTASASGANKAVKVKTAKTKKPAKVAVPSKAAHQKAARIEALRKAKELGAGPKGTLQTLQLLQVICSREIPAISMERDGVLDATVKIEVYSGKLIDRFMDSLMKIMNKICKELCGAASLRAKNAAKTAASLGGSQTLFVSVPQPPELNRTYASQTMRICLELLGPRVLCHESHRRQYLLLIHTLLDKLDVHDEAILCAIVKQSANWIAAPFPSVGKRKAAAATASGVGSTQTSTDVMKAGKIETSGSSSKDPKPSSSISNSTTGVPAGGTNTKSAQHPYVEVHPKTKVEHIASAGAQGISINPTSTSQQQPMVNKLLLKERQQLLQKLEQIEQFNKLPQARELMRSYRELLLRIYDPSVRDDRSKVSWVQQLWPRMVAGLLAHDVYQRKQFFQLFSSQQYKSKGPYAKLQIIIKQDWSHMADTNWLPAALQILLSSLHPSSFVDGESTGHLKMPRFSSSELAAASPLSRGQLPLLESLRRTLSDLRRLKTSNAILDPLQELMYGDQSIRTAKETWLEVFPQAWQALEEQQKMVMTEGLHVLLSRPYHLPDEVSYFAGIQRCAVVVQHALDDISSLVTLSKARKLRAGVAADPFQEILQAFSLRRVSTWTLLAGWHEAPNVVEVLMEGLLRLRPLPILSPELLDYVGGHLGLRHVSIELSELLVQQLQEKDRDVFSRGLDFAHVPPIEPKNTSDPERKKKKKKIAASTTSGTAEPSAGNATSSTSVEYSGSSTVKQGSSVSLNTAVPAFSIGQKLLTEKDGKDGKRKRKKEKKETPDIKSLMESATADAKPALNRANANRWTRTVFDLYRRDDEDMLHGIIRSCCNSAPTFAGLALEASSSWQQAQQTYVNAIRRTEAGDGRYLVARVVPQPDPPAPNLGEGSQQNASASSSAPIDVQPILLSGSDHLDNSSAIPQPLDVSMGMHDGSGVDNGADLLDPNLAPLPMDLFGDEFGGMLDDLADHIGLDPVPGGADGSNGGSLMDPLMLDNFDINFGGPAGDSGVGGTDAGAASGDGLNQDGHQTHLMDVEGSKEAVATSESTEKPKQFIWVPAQLSSLELELWQMRWGNCARQLGQWDNLHELASAQGDKATILESSARVRNPDWSGKIKTLLATEIDEMQNMQMQISQDRPYLPSHLHPNLLPVRPALMNISVAIQEAKSAQEVDHIWRQSANALLLDWSVRGHRGGVGRRRDLLFSCQRLVELEESIAYLTNVLGVASSMKNPVAANQARPAGSAPGGQSLPRSASSSSLQGSTSSASAQKSYLINRLLQRWRERVPSVNEDPKDWDDLLCARLSIFKLGTRFFEESLRRVSSTSVNRGPGGARVELQPAQMQILAASHDTRWTVLERAKVYRKRGMIDESLAILANTILTRQRGSAEEKFIVLRERVLNMLKCENSTAFVNKPRHLAKALTTLLEVDMSNFGVENKAELLRLRAAVQEQLDDGPQVIHGLFAHSVQTHNHASSWLDWALYADRLILAEEAAEGSIYPYVDRDVCTILTGSILQAVKCGSAEARMLLPKVLWRLQAEALSDEMNDDPSNVADAASLSSVANSISMHLPMLPTWIWLPWISQLVALVSLPSSQVNDITKHLLKMLGTEYPNAVYFTLRSHYFGKDSQRKRMAAARNHASSSTPTRQNSSEDVRSNSTTPPSTSVHNDANTPTIRAASGLKAALAEFHSTNGRFFQEAEILIEELSIVVKRHEPLEELHSTIYMLLDKCIQVCTSPHVQTELAASMDVAPSVKVDPEIVRMFQLWQMLERLCVKMFSEQNVARSEQHKELITRLRRPFEEDFQPDPAQMAALRKGNLPPDGVGKSVGGREMSYAAILVRIGRWKGMLTDALYSTRRTRVPLTEWSRVMATMVPETLHVPGMHILKDGLGEPKLCNHPQLDGFHHQVYFRRDTGFSQPGVGFRTSTGRMHHFIVKASPLNHTEADQRAVQLKMLLNDMLERSNSSLRRGQLQFALPVVIPIHARVALQTDTPGTKSLTVLFEESMQREGVVQGKVASAAYFVENLATLQNNGKSLSENRVEALKRMDEVIPEYLLSNHLRSRAQDTWHMLLLRDAMMSSLGLSSFLSSVLSTGQQNPARQLLREDMTLLNVEFRPGYSPDGRGNLLNEEDRVPFRLTRNLEHMMTPAGVQGRFSNVITSVSTCVLNEPVNRVALRSFLESYLFDDLQVMFKFPEQSNAAPSDLYRKLRRNIKLVDRRLDSFSFSNANKTAASAATTQKSSSSSAAVSSTTKESTAPSKLSASSCKAPNSGTPPEATPRDMECQVKLAVSVSQNLSPEEPVAGDSTVARLMKEATSKERLANMDATWLPWF